MGGTEVEGKANRKRKRKRTRSEGNNLLRHQTMEQSKLEERGPLKSDDVPNVPHYSLRSHKEWTAPVPHDMRSCSTITRGRLTRGLRLFTYSKSSDFISRGPIPETASVKKKVEEDFRRIVDPVRSSKVCGSVDSMVDRIVAVSNSKTNNNLSSVTAQSRCYQTTSPVSEPMSVVIVSAEVQETNPVVQTSSPVSSSSHTLERAKLRHKSNGSVSSSAASKDLDNTLDEVMPVNEIADKILQNLKPKFKKLFPTRDLNLELNTNLQKLFSQSSHRINISNNQQVVNGLSLPNLKDNDCQQSLNSNVTTSQCANVIPMAVTTSVSVPTYFQGNKIHRFQSKSDNGEENHIFLADCSRSNTPSPLPPTSPSPPTLSPTPQCPSQSNMHNELSTRFPTHGGLIIDDVYQNPAQSTHQLIHKFTIPSLGQQHIQAATSSSLGFILSNSCDENTETQSLKHSTPHMINFQSDKEDSDNDSGFDIVRYNAFLADAHSLKTKLVKQNKEKQIVSSLSCNHQSAVALSAFGIQRGCKISDVHVPNAHRPPAAYHHQCFQLCSRNRIPVAFYAKTNDSLPEHGNLARSRHQLKTALESIFSSPGRDKSTSRQNNDKLRDWSDDVDLVPITDAFPPMDDTYHCTQPSFFGNPLEEMQVHKSDLQNQARNFLDQLDQEVMDIDHDRCRQPLTLSSSSSSSSYPTRSSWL